MGIDFLRRACGLGLNAEQAPEKCHPFPSMGWRHRVEKRPVVVGTIRSDPVVCKDFAADDHLPLSYPREVLVPRRVVQARQQPNGN